MMRGGGGDGRRDEGYRKGESRIVLHSAKSENEQKRKKRNKRTVRSIAVVKTS